MNKVVEYFLRVVNGTKPGMDAASRDVLQGTRDLAAHMQRVSAQTGQSLKAQWRDFSTSLKSDMAQLASQMPGGRVIADMFSGSALGKVTGAGAIGKTIQNLLLEASSSYKQMSVEIAQTQERMLQKAEQFALKFKKAHEMGTPEAFREIVMSTVEQSGQLRQQLVTAEQGKRDVMDRSFLGMPDIFGINQKAENLLSVTQMRDDQIASLKQDIFHLANVRKYAEEKAERIENQQRSNEEWKAAEDKRVAIEADRSKIIAGMSEDPTVGMYRRGDKAGLQAIIDDSSLKVQNLLGAKPSEEGNAELIRLAEAAAKATEMLDRLSEEERESAKQFWEKEDKQYEAEQSFKQRLAAERFARLSPEQQLAEKRKEYQAVVADGSNQADREKRLASAIKAADLRDSIRDLAKAVEGRRSDAQKAAAEKAAKAAEQNRPEDDDDGFGDDGSGRRLRRVGLGRLRGNRIPGRFSLGRDVGLRARRSHFLGDEAGGVGAPPAEDPALKEARETNVLLREISRKTGFKR